MLIFVIILTAVTVFLLKWIKPYLEFQKIGSYSEYKAVSKTLNDKQLEYSWYQINGFKNINDEAIAYLRQASKRCTKKDLGWLRQCRDFIEAGLNEAEENDDKRLFLPDPIESASLFTILRVIKRCRKPLSTHYRKIGCSTCGEMAVMLIWFCLRIEQIENGEAIKPGDLDYVIDAVYEVRNPSKKSANTISRNQFAVKSDSIVKSNSNEAFEKITEEEKQKLVDMGNWNAVSDAYHKAVCGDVQSMLLLGMVYDLKLYIPKKAFYWMEKAANNGHDRAEYFLGTYYTDGYGIEKDRSKGTDMIIHSATKGTPEAIEYCKNKMEMSVEEMRDLGIPV